jgi:hypothetical protein
MKKTSHSGARLRALIKVRDNARELALEGLGVDRSALALAYWLADPGKGQLLARVRSPIRRQDRSSAEFLGIVYQQWDASFGGDATWDQHGANEFVRLGEMEQEAQRAGMRILQIPVDAKNLPAFFKDWNIPVPNIAQMRVLVDGVAMTDTTTSRMGLAEESCRPVVGAATNLAAGNNWAELKPNTIYRPGLH